MKPAAESCEQRRRAALRWIRAGGVVIAHAADSDPACADNDENLGFGLAATVLEGEPLQITANLRAIGSACRRLKDYAVYLWNCEQQGDYELRIAHRQVSGTGGLISRIAPACYAGSYPQAHLELYKGLAERSAGERISAKLALPRGLCAVIYQANGMNGSHYARCAGPPALLRAAISAGAMTSPMTSSAA